MFRSALAVAVVVLASSVAWAQQPQPPLGELARKEAERRKTTPTPTKVYTNADVKSRPITTATAGVEEQKAGDPKKDAATPATAAAGAQPTGVAPGVAPAAAPQQTTPDVDTRDEAWWRKRMTDIRDSLNRNRVLSEALQSRINALWADFTARDDPAQRGVIEANRREALAELDRVKVEIMRLQQAMADLEEEARRAGVPPGWLR